MKKNDNYRAPIRINLNNPDDSFARSSYDPLGAIEKSGHRVLGWKGSALVDSYLIVSFPTMPQWRVRGGQGFSNQAEITVGDSVAYCEGLNNETKTDHILQHKAYNVKKGNIMTLYLNEDTSARLVH